MVAHVTVRYPSWLTIALAVSTQLAWAPDPAPAGARATLVGVRLDRLDSYLTRFEATVVAASAAEAGTWLRLDRSAFYPTAGGQPHDTGLLGGRRVLDVEDRDGEVWHLLEPGEAPAVGDAVVGEVDWDRRFAHMQRHTAQHMLSQAFMRVGAARGAVDEEGRPGFHTRAVSMRGPDCTLDLTGDPDEEALAAAEEEVNAAARRAVPVMTFEVPEAMLSLYELRRPPKVRGMVRLVAVGDYDLVACGGTHLRTSAEALPVKLLGLERVRGGLTRVTFRAGGEASADHALKHAVAKDLSSLLSAPPADHPARVRALMTRVTELEQELSRTRAKVAAGLAADLLREATSTLPSGARLVTKALEEGEEDLLDPLVERLQDEPGCVSLLAARAGAGARVAFLAGPGAGVDVRPALNAALALLGGRGGGRPDRAQGAGQDASRLGDALAEAAAVLAR
jgi:alanyl-tRNA synthetase